MRLSFIGHGEAFIRFCNLRRFMQKSSIWSLGIAGLLLLGLTSQAQTFEQKTVNIGNIGLNVTNAGTVGLPNVRNNPQGPPSMEYPLNSGIEHLFESGIWIGCKINNQNIAVSTATVDDAAGYLPGKRGFEFTPLPGRPVIERSSLTESPVFSTSAISHQDYVLHFTDSFTIVPNSNQPISDHLTPLRARVKLETYAWDFSYADFFVMLNYEITNVSNATWDSVYLGNWSDLVVRNVNVSTDQGSAFFNKGGIGYVDSLNAIYAYDIAGDPGFTNSYGSIQCLGGIWRGQYFHPKNAAQFTSQGLPAPKIVPNYWIYNLQAPTNDPLRYDRMQNPGDFSPAANLGTPANRVQLLSTGPFVQIAPNESVTLVFAYVCAKQLPDNPKDSPLARTKLLDNLGWARRTFLGEDANENGQLDPGEDQNSNNRLDRFILPEPPSNPKTRVEVENNKVTLYWADNAENSVDPISRIKDFEGYRIYRTNAGDDIKLQLDNRNLLRQYDKTGNSIGFNNGFTEVMLTTPKKFEGDTTEYHYAYTIDNLLNGWQYLFTVVSFDSGNPAIGLPSLESSVARNTRRAYAGTPASAINGDDNDKEIGVYPNPYRVNGAWDGTTSRSRKIMFYNLPRKAEIRIYTLSGEIVTTLNHDADKIFNGSEIQWYKTFGGENPTMPEGEHAWDILSEEKQGIATGLYLFTVKDLKTGKVKEGKFAIIK